MKKILILCSLVSVSLVPTVLPMSAYDYEEKTRSLEEKIEQAEQAELISHCCHAIGCCSETLVGSCAPAVATGQTPDLIQLFRNISGNHRGFNDTPAATDHYTSLGLLAASTIAFFGVGMPHVICYPISDSCHKDAVDLRHSADRLHVELAQNQVSASISMAPSSFTRELFLNEEAVSRQLTFNQNTAARQRE